MTPVGGRCIFLALLGIELMAYGLLGRCVNIQSVPLGLFAVACF
jgi:hypothetical protein